MVLKIVKTVWPVMLTYVAIGAPCGMIMAQTGMEPWMVFALSSTGIGGRLRSSDVSCYRVAVGIPPLQYWVSNLRP